jgi:iron-sulfur cluster assembly protein
MVRLTEQAADKVKFFLNKRGHGLGIKLGVKTTGCSGLGYVLEYVDNEYSDCVVFNSHEIKIFVNNKDHVYLDGLTLDWKRQGLNEGFEFINPNEAGRCGCGSSFNV